MVSARIRTIAAIAAPLLIPFVGTTPVASAAASSDVAQWPGGLRGVSTISASHAWAVGNTQTTGFLLYWNGIQWKKSSLVLPGRASELHSVDARTANDIWVVGYYFPDSSSRLLSLIEHWDGTGWRLVRAPASSRELYSVSADSATDAWAAGFGARAAVLLHWDGSRWSKHVAKAACCRILRQFSAVEAVSPTDAWAVGSTGGRVPTFLTMHWDGVAWRRVPSALPGREKVDGELLSVSATSSSDVWAVGNYTTTEPRLRFYNFIEHWDGHVWRQTTSPTGDQGAAIFYGVSAATPVDAWVVGYRLRPSRTVTDRWDGDEWVEVDSPDPGLLFAVDASSSSNAWAVGGRMGRTLIERWDGHTWRES
jgi:hypothetical protein